MTTEQSLDNACYHEQQALTRELTSIFASSWQFVCMTDEVASPRDFVSIELPDDSIVVQNFSGELRAFRNICPHRLNLIQTAERGNRPFVCQYHGWAFDSEGAPRGVGERQGFEGASSQLCLTRYRVETCGRFVFVARDVDTPPLDECLGPFAQLLRDISEHIGKEYHYGEVPHAANWKLLVENVLECYHCASVHPETFVKGLGVGKKPIAEVETWSNESGATHSSSHFPREPVRRENLRKRLVAHLDGRDFKHDSFFHIHIFPNLFISSTEGATFYVGHAIPVATDQTRLKVRFFDSAVPLEERDRIKQDAINERSIPLGLQVIDEDRVILENVQRGISRTDQRMALGNEEVRIRAFHAGYQRQIGS